MSTDFAFTPVPPSRADIAPRPAAVAELSGSWRGRFHSDDGASEPFTLLRDGSSDALVVGRFLFFASRDVAPTGVKLLEASNRAFVALIGPYFDANEQTEVVTVLEGMRDGNRIEGTFHTRLQNWRDEVRSGRFVAVRAESAHRAA